jgi:DNA (cytosine-5)-methyltransferase 1
MDTTKAITHIGLCAGYGGIELGLQRVIPSLRSVALCEIEAYAIANLVAKMEAGLMDPAPIWPDLKTFPWGAFRGRVDILTGGYPCQPFSAAGQRKGKQDPRHLWPWIADGIRLLRPRICFFENVEGHISLGLSDVIEDLAGMGYRTTWGIFSASEVGAPHQRKRVFILAYAKQSIDRCKTRWHEIVQSNTKRSSDWISGSGQELAYCDSERGQLSHWWQFAAESLPISNGQARGDVWPSRPEEPQYGWEPPRVVSGLEDATGQRSRCEGGDALHQGWAASEAGTESVPQDTGWSDGTAIADHQPTGGDGSELGDAKSRQDNGREPGDMGEEASQGGCCDDATDCAGEELGDTGCERQEERQVEAGGSEQSDQDLADTSILGSDGRSDGSSGRSWKPGEVSVDAAGCGGQGNGMRQTQPPLGGDADGIAGGLDYAELCVSCDNRTDELRLLGNGVVPHTAELAFRVLIQELANE